tara:strand:+ start:913 stop:2040 length:1128 start_codon:yes stop_codon:yes gene_type:complete
MAKRKPKKSVTLNPFGIEPIFEKGKTPKDEVLRRVAYGNASAWYNYESGPKDHVSYVLDYAKDVLGYSKDDVKALKKLPDWGISAVVGIPCHMYYRGWNLNATEKKRIVSEMIRKLTVANAIVVEVVAAVPVISPAEKVLMKVNATIGKDYDILMEEFGKGNFKQKLSAFNLIKSYNLNPAHINFFEKDVMHDYETIRDAFKKTCDQAVEAYSHVPRPDLKKMYEALQTIVDDIEQVKSAKKAVRQVRVKKPQAADKQIKRLKFKTDDNTYKIASINPALIPTAAILFTFNTKTRLLTMFKSDSVDGFTVKGTTINGFNPALSKCTTLRKPEESLKVLMKGNIKKAETIWDTLTTKVREPKGRISTDVILLRVST